MSLKGQVIDGDPAPPVQKDSPRMAAGQSGTQQSTALADRAESIEEADEPSAVDGRRRWPFVTKPRAGVLAYAVLPALALLLALGAGYLKWQHDSARLATTAAAQSIQAATESTIAVLSYQPETVENDLRAAGERLTGQFKNDYKKLTADVVIPGAKQKHISAVARVPAAASVSASANHAVVLVFVDQTTVMGSDPPTDSASSVRVTLDKVGDRWLISAFDPV
jgi:Mce-associated membrane protein